MTIKRFTIPGALICTLFFSFCTRAQAPGDKKMPAGFRFYTLADSSAFTADNFQRSRKNLVIFFDATCEHCQQEVYAIGKRNKEFDNVQIYLVTMDDKQQAGKFMSIYGKELKDKKNVMVLLDPNREFLPKFDPERFPAIYIYSANRELVWHKDGEREVDDILEALKIND